MRFERAGTASWGASAKALGETGTENGLKGGTGFERVKQKGKSIPGGRDRMSKGRAEGKHCAPGELRVAPPRRAARVEADQSGATR